MKDIIKFQSQCKTPAYLYSANSNAQMKSVTLKKQKTSASPTKEVYL